MFRWQANTLRQGIGDLSLEAVQAQINELSRVLTSCGPIYRDTDGGPFEIYGESLPDAGVSGDHTILHVTQGNQRAGEATNPHLYAAIFDGPVKFTFPVQAARRATATANWTGANGTGTVAATDNTTGDAITITLYSTGKGMDPNVRSGDTVPYWRTNDGVNIAISDDDAIGTVKMWKGTAANVRGGWTILTAAHQRYIRAHESTAGGTGGVNSHTHVATASSIAPVISVIAGVVPSGATEDVTPGAGSTVALANHGHDASQTSHSHTIDIQTASNEPNYYDLILIERTS